MWINDSHVNLFSLKKNKKFKILPTTVVIGTLRGNWQISFWGICCIFPKYLDRQAWANSVDPDQMPQNVASDQGPHIH